MEKLHEEKATLQKLLAQKESELQCLRAKLPPTTVATLPVLPMPRGASRADSSSSPESSVAPSSSSLCSSARETSEQGSARLEQELHTARALCEELTSERDAWEDWFQCGWERWKMR